MRRMAPVLAALALLLAAAVAHATVVLRCAVEDLTDLCHRAVVGTVTAKSVEHDRARGQIWTTYRVRTDETWLGEAAAEVVVSVPGGEADGVTQEFHGGAELARGERAAVFLWKRDDGRLLVVGEAQGAFRIRRDPETGDETAANDVAGLAFVDRAGKRVDAGPTKTTLADLRARVRAAREAREAREKAAREARERLLAERRRRADVSADLSRGKPGGAPQ